MWYNVGLKLAIQPTNYCSVNIRAVNSSAMKMVISDRGTELPLFPEDTCIPFLKRGHTFTHLHVSHFPLWEKSLHHHRSGHIESHGVDAMVTSLRDLRTRRGSMEPEVLMKSWHHHNSSTTSISFHLAQSLNGFKIQSHTYIEAMMYCSLRLIECKIRDFECLRYLRKTIYSTIAGSNVQSLLRKFARRKWKYKWNKK